MIILDLDLRRIYGFFLGLARRLLSFSETIQLAFHGPVEPVR